MSKLVYLGGPITGLTYAGSTDWRELAKQELAYHGIKGISPMRGKEYLSNQSVIADSYDDKILSNAKAITHRDFWDVRRCDVIFANLLGAERVSIGTMLEAGAAAALNKPLVLAMEEGNIHRHSMLNTSSGWVASSLNEALMVIKALLL